MQESRLRKLHCQRIKSLPHFQTNQRQRPTEQNLQMITQSACSLPKNLIDINDKLIPLPTLIIFYEGILAYT